MQPRVDITVYNEQAIKDWNEELKNIPSKIVAQEGLISGQEKEIEPLKTRLFPIQKEINRIDVEIARRRRMYEEERRHHYQYHHNNHHASDVLSDTFETFMGDEELNALRRAKNSYMPDKEDLEKQINSHQEKIDAAKSIVRSLKSKRKKITEELIPGAEDFLDALANKPEKLFREFRATIEKDLRCYHKSHFEQEPVVRDAFLKLTEKLDAILESDINITHGNYEQLYLVESEKREWQIKYAILCGYLWDALYQLEYKDSQDEDFKKVIHKLLEKTHISESGDLPDKLYTGLSTLNQFDAYKKSYKFPELYKHYNDEELERFEINEYEQARTDFYKVANDSYDKSIKLVEDMHADLQIPRKGNEEESKLSLYTRTIRLETKMLSMSRKDRSRSEEALELADIADHISGKPSACKKVLGGLVFFLGATVIAGSVISAIGTFGGSSVLSGFGVAFGASMVTYGLALAGAGLTGGTLAYLGGRLFKSGMRQGISKDVKESLDELTKPEESTQVLAPPTRPRFA